MSSTKEISFVDLILNFWKFKIKFFIILVTLLLLSILLENFIPKKDSIEMKLKETVIVNLEFYPINVIHTLELDLSSINLDKILIKSNRIEIDFVHHYFEENLRSGKNLINFAKANNDKFKLYKYISKNNIIVKKKLIINEDKYKYSLILPKSENNKIFFKEYFDYITNISLKQFQEDLIMLENKKLKLIEDEFEFIDRNFYNSTIVSPATDQTVKKNLEIIQKLQKIRVIKINENIKFIEDTVKNFDNDWIVDGPVIKTVGKKFYNVSKFTLPVILSLIIYLLYILIRLSTQENQNKF